MKPEHNESTSFLRIVLTGLYAVIGYSHPYLLNDEENQKLPKLPIQFILAAVINGFALMGFCCLILLNVISFTMLNIYLFIAFEVLFIICFGYFLGSHLNRLNHTKE